MWLGQNMPDLAALLQPVATGLVTDGRMIGAASARVMTGGGALDTGTWKPGDTAEATRVLGELGLDAGSDDDAPAAAGEIAHGVLTSLGRVLVDGVQAGAKAADIARNLLAALADKAKAAAGALGELVKAIGQAAADWYRKRQVEYVTWFTEDDGRVCALCLDNEDAGAVRFGEPFPDGSVSPPGHPRCRCCLAVAPAP